MDIKAIGSPLWWASKLWKQLDAQAIEAQKWHDYYSGEFPLPGNSATLNQAKKAYRELVREGQANWSELVVDATEERLTVEGFRFGSADINGGDSDVWSKIWQPADLDSHQSLVHQEALVTGRSYVLVWHGETPDDLPLITAESSSDVICAYDRGRTIAALKRWVDPWTDEILFAVYLPSVVTRFRLPGKTKQDLAKAVLDGENSEIPNTFGQVPIVEFQTKPKLRRPPVSEIAGIAPIQDRINRTVFSRLLAQEFAAFPQRWVVGLDLERDAEGAPIAPFNVGVDKLLVSEQPDTKFGSFTESNLAAYIAGAESDIRHLAAISRTPPHYLLGDMVNLSGEALKSAENGLVHKVRRRARVYGSAWERVIRLGLAAIDDARSSDTSCRVVWTNPQTPTEGELVDALVKMGSLGVPRPALWQRWGVEPQEIDRWVALGLDNPAAPDPATATNPGATP